MINYLANIIKFVAAVILLSKSIPLHAESQGVPVVNVLYTDDQMNKIFKSLALALVMDKDKAIDFSLDKANHKKVINDVLSGEADIGVLTVKPLYKYRRRGLTVKPFAVFPVVWAVNSKNPVFGMTSRQLADIYSGKIKTWKVFNNTGYTIHLAGMQTYTPASDLMIKLLMKDKAVSATMYSASRPSELIAMASGNRNSLVFMPYFQLENAQIKYINIDSVKPAKENFISGKYPFLKVFYLVHKGDHSRAADKFIAYLKSKDIKSLFSNAGLILY